MTQDERLDRIDANIERLTKFVLDFRDETARRLDLIDNRLNVLATNVNNIELRFPTITAAILDFGKVSTELTNDLFKNRHATAELAARMDRLEEKTSKLLPAA